MDIIEQYCQINNDIRTINDYIYSVNSLSATNIIFHIIKDKFIKDLIILKDKKKYNKYKFLASFNNQKKIILDANLIRSDQINMMIVQFINSKKAFVDNKTIKFVQQIIILFNSKIQTYKHNVFHAKKFNISLDNFNYLYLMINSIVIICDTKYLKVDIENLNIKFEEAIQIKPNQKEIHDRFRELYHLVDKNIWRISNDIYIEYEMLRKFVDPYSYYY